MNKLLELSTLLTNVAIICFLTVIYLEIRPEPVEPLSVAAEISLEENSDESENSLDDMELARKELSEKWSDAGLTDVYQAIKDGEEVLAKSDASVEELIQAGKRSNAAANFVGYIQEEYADYYRDNYKYDFVQKKISPSHDKYVALGNKLKGIRNTAYLLIGLKLKEEGRVGEAFFYFRDAFRLSTFDGYKKSDPGTRYIAEQEMKEILGIKDIESYKTWQ